MRDRLSRERGIERTHPRIEYGASSNPLLPILFVHTGSATVNAGQALKGVAFISPPTSDNKCYNEATGGVND